MEETGYLMTYDTPWRCSAEFNKVYQYLYLSNPSNSSFIQYLTLARNKILVWLMRGPNFKYNLELQVTQHFLNAVITDREYSTEQEFTILPNDSSVIDSIVTSTSQENNSNQSKHGELILPSLYSTAVVKFCEMLKFYTLEYGAVKRLSSKDIVCQSERSEKLGIPEWIIDARNQASHSSIPSLDLLRHASFICMDWLNRHFWRPKNERRLDLQVATAFQDITQRTDNLKTSLTFFINFLTRDSTSTILLLTKILIEMNSVPVPENLTASWSPRRQQLIPQEILDSVQPVFRLVLRAGLLHELLMNLVSKFDSMPTEYSIRSIYWFCQIVTCMTSYKPKTNITIRRKIIRNNSKFALEYKNILYAICMKPSVTTKALILHMKPLIPFARDTITQKLMHISDLCHLTNDSLLTNGHKMM